MNILITAGPTREPIDPVRYLTNRSSGKMGYAIAGAAVHEGHRVLLISGPTSLDVPDGVDFLQVETAAEMYEVVGNHIGRMDAAVFSAAVADYTPAHVAGEKIKKAGETLTMELVKTKDILGSARVEMGFKGYLVGFAAETENLEENSRSKLERKGCNLVVGNDVSRTDIGFDSEDNEALLVFPKRTETFAKATKYELAMRIVQTVEGGDPKAIL
ncbi:MAG: phosphopantothenoylcysteine decarboxylase domain-containing protein [Luteolibacter sp.]